MPASAGEIRPSATTAAASVNTSPAPPVANWPRCTRCQSFGTPSTEEYWHIGDTQTRLRTVTSRRVIGLNSWLTKEAPDESTDNTSANTERPPVFLGPVFLEPRQAQPTQVRATGRASSRAGSIGLPHTAQIP